LPSFFSSSAAKNAGGLADFCVAKALTCLRVWAAPTVLRQRTQFYGSAHSFQVYYNYGGIKMADCIFCKIIEGEIPSNTLYEDEKFKVILDVSPANKGHSLIIPKEHYENIFEIPEALEKEAFSLAKKTAKILMTSGFGEGINILQNNNEAAGQTVNHFHIHVIPRKSGDTVTIKAKPIDLNENEMKDIKDILSKNF